MWETLQTIKEALPYLLSGIPVTMTIVAVAMLTGLLLGIPLAVLQVYGNKKIAFLASCYIWFFRGVPILVLLFLFYFGLFSLLNLNLSPFTASWVVLGLCTAAYQSQIFRGAILSLPQGQFKAAKALGMSDFQAIRNIILPQAIRLALPGWSNEYSIVLKDSAVAFVLGTTEIMARTHFVASRTYEHLPLYITAAIFYFILTWIGVKIILLIEKKFHIPGYGLSH